MPLRQYIWTIPRWQRLRAMGRRYDPCSFVGPRGARPAERRMVMAGPSPIVDEIQRAPDATHLGSSATWVIERRRDPRSEEHTSELQSLAYLVCRLLLEKKKYYNNSQSQARQSELH